MHRARSPLTGSLRIVVLLAAAAGCSDPTATRSPTELLFEPDLPEGAVAAPALLAEARDALQARLDGARRRATVTLAGPQLRVVLAPGVPQRSLEGLRASLGLPLQLGLHEVDDAALRALSAPLPAGARLIDDPHLGATVEVAGREPATAVVRALQPLLPPGDLAAGQAPRRPGGPWVVLALKPASLGNDAIAEARVSTAGKNPATVLALAPSGAKALAALSSRLVGRRIAVTLDGQVLAAPYVTAPIPDGRVQITFGTARAVEEQRADAEAVALALSLRRPLPVVLRLVGETAPAR